MASKANHNRDDPGAFPAREWLRKMCVGKNVSFETRSSRTASSSGAADRVYGVLLLPNPNGDGSQLNLAVEAVRNGHATPKVFGHGSRPRSGGGANSGGGNNSGNNGNDDDADGNNGTDGNGAAASSADDGAADGSSAGASTNTNSGYEDPVQLYERQLHEAFQSAKSHRVGVHSSQPLVRTIQNAGDDFKTQHLVKTIQQHSPNGRVTCVIEYIFDGSRFRCQVTGPTPEMERAGILYGSFTLILAGVASPRMGNPRANPPTADEAFAVDARDFVSTRLLHRELEMTIHGTDKAGVCAVGTVHHPRGNIAVELLKAGLARVSDWSARMMDPRDVPAFRIAENNAKVRVCVNMLGDVCVCVCVCVFV